jgi:6-phosphofructokinase 1
MAHSAPTAIGVLTSGGDAQGMNAALRAVTRSALRRGVAVYAIHEGYQGMVDGGDRIRPLGWNDVGGITHRGGTVIGTARSAAFRERAGRLAAARNLLGRGIDGLVVIGGDGSLTGADLFRREWPSLLAELVEAGAVAPALAERHGRLGIVGLVGSIDNDMVGTDMTIGADSALHRITEAIDAISSTAASHQRTFVIEVMGRHCGYLALMGAVAGGADWAIIPEDPPEAGWQARMCALIRAGRAAGRRDSIVVVAEGAIDRAGAPITSREVQQALEAGLGEEARLTILGHVQRGGAPSAYDRWMSAVLGFQAVDELLTVPPDREPQVIGVRANRVARQPLMACVEQTRAVADVLAGREFERAMALRGGGFTEMEATFRALAQALPSVSTPRRRGRLAVLHAGGPAPGMNTAVRAAVRLGLDQGHEMLAARNGFAGLIAGEVEAFAWGSVDGWAPRGGAELGSSYLVPAGPDVPRLARQIEAHGIDGLLVIGGWTGLRAARALQDVAEAHPALDIPIACLPATINNDLPGVDLCVGADTALNTIVEALDKIKQSAVALRRCFVVEVMGRYCGYLALLSGLAAGAERVYLHEEGVTLADLQADLATMLDGFRAGKRLSLIIRAQHANPLYTTDFLRALFEQESQGLFDVRHTILGHLQDGGDPSPFDRILATRLAARCILFLTETLGRGADHSALIGYGGGQVAITRLEDAFALADEAAFRPKEQWWLELAPIARALAQPGPGAAGVGPRD